MSNSSQTTNSRSETAPWDPQAYDLQQLLQKSNDALATSQAVPAYTGNMVAGVNAQGANAMSTALNNTYGSMGSASFLQGAGKDAVGGGTSNVYSALSGLQGIGAQSGTTTAANTAAAAQQYMNPSIINNQTQAAMRSANQNFTENVMPTLATQSAMTGNGLSTREGIAQGIAERGLNQTAADTSANLTANAYNTGINAAQAANQQQLSALSSAGSLGSNLASLGSSNVASGINGAATTTNTINTANNANIGYAQDALTNALDKTNYQVTQPFQSLDMYSALVNNRSMGTERTGTSTTETNPSLMSTIGSGLGAVSGIMGKCDRAVKTDIKQIGKTDAGLPIYVFRYKNDNERKFYVGLMADDVAAIDPSMVIDINGIKHIRANDFYATL